MGGTVFLSTHFFVALDFCGFEVHVALEIVVNLFLLRAVVSKSLRRMTRALLYSAFCTWSASAANEREQRQRKDGDARRAGKLRSAETKLESSLADVSKLEHQLTQTQRDVAQLRLDLGAAVEARDTAQHEYRKIAQLYETIKMDMDAEIKECVKRTIGNFAWRSKGGDPSERQSPWHPAGPVTYRDTGR